jgi:hypothetical protein
MKVYGGVDPNTKGFNGTGWEREMKWWFTPLRGIHVWSFQISASMALRTGPSPLQKLRQQTARSC